MSTCRMVIFALFSVVAGCSSILSKPSEPKRAGSATTGDDEFDALSDDSGAPSKNGRRKAAPALRAEELKPLDFSPDGFPRIKKFYNAENKSSDPVLERVETDFNGDGRVDFIQWYDSTGTWVEKDASDLNGDGLIDVISNYKKNLIKDEPELILQKFTTPRSKETNLWKYFRNGELRMRAIDRNLDGKPDYWEYYDKGRLVRTDVDSNGDVAPTTKRSFLKSYNPKAPNPKFANSIILAESRIRNFCDRSDALSAAFGPAWSVLRLTHAAKEFRRLAIFTPACQ